MFDLFPTGPPHRSPVEAFSHHADSRGNPVVAAVTVPDRAEWPVLAPGQVVLVERLRPCGANYFEQVFAVRYRGRVLVRHTSPGFGGVWTLFGRHDGFRCRQPGAIEVDTHDVPGWTRPDWQTSGLVHPDLTLLGPVVYPYGFAARLDWGTPDNRPLDPLFYAWAN